jgi:hypothetical protein
MDQERFSEWLIYLFPVLWAVFLCGLTLCVGSGRLLRVVVTVLLLISWLVHTPVCGYVVAFTGAAILSPYGSHGTWIMLGSIASGLIVVWVAHLGAVVTIWQSNAERVKQWWALAFPGGWLLIGLGYVLWWVSVRS